MNCMPLYEVIMWIRTINQFNKGYDDEFQLKENILEKCDECDVENKESKDKNKEDLKDKNKDDKDKEAGKNKDKEVDKNKENVKEKQIVIKVEFTEENIKLFQQLRDKEKDFKKLKANEQKNILGELLFPIVKKCCPDKTAPKITGILIDAYGYDSLLTFQDQPKNLETAIGECLKQLLILENHKSKKQNKEKQNEKVVEDVKDDKVKNEQPKPKIEKPNEQNKLDGEDNKFQEEPPPPQKQNENDDKPKLAQSQGSKEKVEEHKIQKEPEQNDVKLQDKEADKDQVNEKKVEPVKNKEEEKEQQPIKKESPVEKEDKPPPDDFKQPINIKQMAEQFRNLKNDKELPDIFMKNLTKEEQEELLKAAENQQGKDLVNIKEPQKQLSEQQITDLKQAFDLFDADGSEEFDEDQLNQVMKAIGLESTKKNCVDLIAEYSIDGNGIIYFEQFLELMSVKMFEEPENQPKEQEESVQKKEDHKLDKQKEKEKEPEQGADKEKEGEQPQEKIVKEEEKIVKEEEEKEGEQELLKEDDAEDQIVIEDPNIINKVKIELNGGGIVYGPDKDLIKRVIRLNIKSFIGEMRIIKIDIDISQSVDRLCKLLMSAYEEFNIKLYDIKVYYPLVELRQLMYGFQIRHYELPTNATLLMMANTSFTWDLARKHVRLTNYFNQLENSNNTCRKSSLEEFQTVFATSQIFSGIHYWEIKIMRCYQVEGVIIGLANNQFQVDDNPIESPHFLGYMSQAGLKVGIDGKIEPYGFVCKERDIIGVLLEYQHDVGRVSFYKNGVACGVAFKNLQGPFYPVVSFYQGEAQVVLESKAQMPLI